MNERMMTQKTFEILSELGQNGDFDKIIRNTENIQLIEPREDISTVGIGNKVFLSYDGGDEQEFLILSRYDRDFREDLEGKIISNESPLGKLIMGRKTGETVILEIRDTEKKIEIVKIEKGDF